MLDTRMMPNEGAELQQKLAQIKVKLLEFKVFLIRTLKTIDTKTASPDNLHIAIAYSEELKAIEHIVDYMDAHPELTTNPDLTPLEIINHVSSQPGGFKGTPFIYLLMKSNRARSCMNLDHIIQLVKQDILFKVVPEDNASILSILICNIPEQVSRLNITSLKDVDLSLLYTPRVFFTLCINQYWMKLLKRFPEILANAPQDLLNHVTGTGVTAIALLASTNYGRKILLKAKDTKFNITKETLTTCFTRGGFAGCNAAFLLMSTPLGRRFLHYQPQLRANLPEGMRTTYTAHYAEQLKIIPEDVSNPTFEIESDTKKYYLLQQVIDELIEETDKSAIRKVYNLETGEFILHQPHKANIKFNQVLNHRSPQADKTIYETLSNLEIIAILLKRHPELAALLGYKNQKLYEARYGQLPAVTPPKPMPTPVKSPSTVQISSPASKQVAKPVEFQNVLSQAQEGKWQESIKTIFAHVNLTAEYHRDNNTFAIKFPLLWNIRPSKESHTSHVNIIPSPDTIINLYSQLAHRLASIGYADLAYDPENPYECVLLPNPLAKHDEVKVFQDITFKVINGKVKDNNGKQRKSQKSKQTTTLVHNKLGKTPPPKSKHPRDEKKGDQQPLQLMINLFQSTCHKQQTFNFLNTCQQIIENDRTLTITISLDAIRELSGYKTHDYFCALKNAMDKSYGDSNPLREVLLQKNQVILSVDTNRLGTIELNQSSENILHQELMQYVPINKLAFFNVKPHLTLNQALPAVKSNKNKPRQEEYLNILQTLIDIDKLSQEEKDHKLSETELDIYHYLKYLLYCTRLMRVLANEFGKKTHYYEVILNWSHVLRHAYHHFKYKEVRDKMDPFIQELYKNALTNADVPDRNQLFTDVTLIDKLADALTPFESAIRRRKLEADTPQDIKIKKDLLYVVDVQLSNLMKSPVTNSIKRIPIVMLNSLLHELLRSLKLEPSKHFPSRKTAHGRIGHDFNASFEDIIEDAFSLFDIEWNDFERYQQAQRPGLYYASGAAEI